MFIKIHNLTDIQETLGETERDNILRNMTKQIHSLVRDNDVVGRWSDNECVIVLNNVSHPKRLAIISQRILNTIKQSPILLENQLSLKLSHTIKINSLVGVS